MTAVGSLTRRPTVTPSPPARQPADVASVNHADRFPIAGGRRNRGVSEGGFGDTWVWPASQPAEAVRTTTTRTARRASIDNRQVNCSGRAASGLRLRVMSLSSQSADSRQRHTNR
jgi:hypothetical protein